MDAQLNWRNRIIETKLLDVSTIKDHPLNWRTHPQQQAEALEAVLEEVGIVDELKAYYSERNDGALTLMNGHKRKSLGGLWPVDILDINDAEADLMLTVFDPIAALAGTNNEMLDALLHEVNTGSEALQGLLEDMAIDAGIVPPDDPYEHYKGMPDYDQEDKGPLRSIVIHFERHSDVDDFARILNQTITDKTKSLWHPYKPHEVLKNLGYKDES